MKPSYGVTMFCFVFLFGVQIFWSSHCFGQTGIDSLASQSQLEGYPIASSVFTTRQKTIVPVTPSGSETISPFDISKYKQNGYGEWAIASGTDSGKFTDIMPDGYKASGALMTNTAKLLHFFTITDIHITDKESPAQLIYGALGNLGFKDNAISVYSGIMLYTTHLFDAAIQTVNAISKQNKIDFGISLGDTCNSNQYNELRWYIDVLDGKNISPDSGVKDDPIPGPYNDYQDQYKAAGLDKTIPWYQALGNHDQFWMGSKPVSEYLRQTFIGEDILKMGNPLLPGGIDKRDYYMGVFDGRTLYGDIIGAGPVASFPTGPAKIAADPNRHSLSRKDWLSEFFKTSSNPVGHGFTQANLADDFACYSFEPKSDIPIKVIVLDDTVKENTPGLDPKVHIYGYGTLDKTRYDWLVSELKEGQANNKLMIIAAHVPIGVEPKGSPTGWWPKGYVYETELIAELHKYPNLILWIAGHRHRNTITPFKSPDTTHPELGFWGVETQSLREFPQRFRTFEIFRNSDKTISILATDVDPAVKEGAFAAVSRSYGIAADQLFNIKPEAALNAELVKQLSPEMQTKLQNCGTLVGK
ncbi:MAG: TIGR03768 family metallophosphoesterase [Candidatus Ozemobacteraceae bacterium]